MNNLVSIIMPSYNTSKYIGEAIDSVLSQTYEEWELLIVDDCSTDSTNEIVASYNDKRIKYYKNEKNSGAAISRNKALQEANGRWIAFLDSDDLWSKDKLEKQISFMKNNGYAFSYTNYEKIDEDDKPLNVLVTGPKIVTKRKMYHYCYLGCLTVMYDTTVIGKIQIDDIKKNNDYAMWLQTCKKSSCFLLNENLAKYRIRKKSISHDKFSKKIKSHYDLFHVCDGKSAFASFWFSCWNVWFGIWKKIVFEKKNKTINKIAIVGHFGFGLNLLNGQTIKTKTIADVLEKKYGANNVSKIDTHGGFFAILKICYQVKISIQKSKNIVILPGERGLKLIAPLLVKLNKHKRRRLHYVVVGGWIADFCSVHLKLANKLKSFDYIYVETFSMKDSLIKLGFTNVVVMPNFKNITPLSEKELVYSKNKPFSLCTFSRVMKEKGIEDAVRAVDEANKIIGETTYLLDIYGQIDSKQIKWFSNLKMSFPKSVKYCGEIPSDKSIGVIKNYFMLLFPTFYPGEGFGGTILDAMAAGVPVIASDWKYNSEIVNDNTGFLFRAGFSDELRNLLLKIANNPELVFSKKNACLKTSLLYTPAIVINVLLERIDC